MFVFREANAPPESRWCPDPPGKDSRAGTPSPPCGTGSAGRWPAGWPSIARVRLLDPHLLAHPAPQVRAPRADRRRGALGHPTPPEDDLSGPGAHPGPARQGPNAVAPRSLALPEATFRHPGADAAGQPPIRTTSSQSRVSVGITNLVPTVPGGTSQRAR
jgi:hypothetical protein